MTRSYPVDELIGRFNRDPQLAGNAKHTVALVAKAMIPSRPTPDADFEAHLGGTLRLWAESILFDPCTAKRRIEDPAFLCTLMARHTSGLKQ